MRYMMPGATAGFALEQPRILRRQAQTLPVQELRPPPQGSLALRPQLHSMLSASRCSQRPSSFGKAGLCSR